MSSGDAQCTTVSGFYSYILIKVPLFMRVCLTDTMAENGRLSKLTEVINLYIELMSAHRGEVICKVTTAKVRSLIINPS